MTDTRILLADDHPVVREGLRFLLEKSPNNHVVGESDAHSPEAVKMAKETQPDVLITDQGFVDEHPLAFVKKVRELTPNTRILIFSMNRDKTSVRTALRNGVHGYVSKDSGSAEIIRAVKLVAAGEKYISPRISEKMTGSNSEFDEKSPASSCNKLTRREKEVLQLVAEGKSYSEIGKRLFISPRTAESHRAHLMQKLQLKTLSDLIRFAILHGLVAIDE
jgi:DNA-binding NarL/FixJ family response regulator